MQNQHGHYVICYFDKQAKYRRKNNIKLNLTHTKIYEIIETKHKLTSTLIKIKNDTGKTIWYNSGRFVSTQNHEKELNIFLRTEKLKKIENYET